MTKSWYIFMELMYNGVQSRYRWMGQLFLKKWTAEGSEHDQKGLDPSRDRCAF